MAIPWPDRPCMLIAAYVHGSDERGKIIRRTLARYLNLLAVLTFQAVSTAVKKRFPTLDHVEESGLMTKEERRVYDEIPVTHGKWWVPAQWFSSLAARARKEGRIKDDVLLNSLLDEMHTFRGNCGMLFSYDWISIPLVYTQVVTLAIYTYFLATVMGRQYLDPGKGYPGHEVDLYIPIFTILQFFFYMGWLKVAEQLINPFGEDDDDFELNWCLDRNLQVSFMIVDEMYQRHPRLVRDIYWDELEPQLPYTKSSLSMRTQPHLGSAVNLDVDPEEAEFLPMETILEEDNDDNNYNSPPTSPTSDFFPPGFRSISGSKTNLGNDCNDSSSQSGLRLFSDFPGSKILNMIIGSSSENVCGTPKKDTNFLPQFVLKTPNRRSRTSSVAESLNSHILDVRKEEGDYLISDHAQNSSHSETHDDHRHLVLEIPPDTNPPDSNVHGTPAMIIEEYAKRHDQNPTVSFASDVQSDVAHTSESHRHNQEEPESPNPEKQSPYEPNTSQESLGPYVDSNQSTVSSYAELLQHPK